MALLMRYIKINMYNLGTFPRAKANLKNIEKKKT